MNILYIEHEAEGYDNIFDAFVNSGMDVNAYVACDGKLMQVVFPLGRKTDRNRYQERMARIKKTPRRAKKRRM